MSAPPPSEASRLAELRARIGTQVRTSRQRQGLPDHVTDPATLDGLAGWVELALDTLAREERDMRRQPKPDRARRATTRHQGKGRGREGSGNGGVLTGAGGTGAAVMTPNHGPP